METYKTEGAETVFLTMGSTGDTVAMAVDELRDQGKSVGLIKLRLWRPFPFDEFREAAKGAKRIIVLDRAVSYGGPGGPVASEIRSVFYGEDNMPGVTNFSVRSGRPGRHPQGLHRPCIRTLRRCVKGKVRQEDYVFYGVRE